MLSGSGFAIELFRRRATACNEVLVSQFMTNLSLSGAERSRTPYHHYSTGRRMLRGTPHALHEL